MDPSALRRRLVRSISSELRARVFGSTPTPALLSGNPLSAPVQNSNNTNRCAANVGGALSGKGVRASTQGAGPLPSPTLQAALLGNQTTAFEDEEFLRSFLDNAAAAAVASAASDWAGADVAAGGRGEGGDIIAAKGLSHAQLSEEGLGQEQPGSEGKGVGMGITGVDEDLDEWVAQHLEHATSQRLTQSSGLDPPRAEELIGVADKLECNRDADAPVAPGIDPTATADELLQSILVHPDLQAALALLQSLPQEDAPRSKVNSTGPGWNGGQGDSGNAAEGEAAVPAKGQLSEAQVKSAMQDSSAGIKVEGGENGDGDGVGPLIQTGGDTLKRPFPYSVSRSDSCSPCVGQSQWVPADKSSESPVRNNTASTLHETAPLSHMKGKGFRHAPNPSGGCTTAPGRPPLPPQHCAAPGGAPQQLGSPGPGGNGKPATGGKAVSSVVSMLKGTLKRKRSNEVQTGEGVQPGTVADGEDAGKVRVDSDSELRQRCEALEAQVHQVIAEREELAGREASQAQRIAELEAENFRLSRDNERLQEQARKSPSSKQGGALGRPEQLLSRGGAMHSRGLVRGAGLRGQAGNLGIGCLQNGFEGPHNGLGVGVVQKFQRM